jgi:MFS family permease
MLEGRQLGWPVWVWLVLAAGVAALGLLGLLEARRGGRRNDTREEPVPLLRTGLFRVPAFAAGLGVQMAFSAGLQGFFLAFALWLQAGEHFSPLKAGLTAVAFSAGSFIGAPAAVPAEVAGGASGLFGTAQQLGGALGVAVFGTVFFGYLNGHSFEAAIVHTTPYAMGAFALCAVLSMLLPRTAVARGQDDPRGHGTAAGTGPGASRVSRPRHPLPGGSGRGRAEQHDCGSVMGRPVRVRHP